MSSTRLIAFTKMHGLGNDFVVIDAVTHAISLTPENIKFISDRFRGIGCDQVLLIEKPVDAESDFFYRIYNADGSEVGQCGNGARCIAKFIRDKNLSAKDTLRVKTITSILTLYIKDNTIRVEMGIPHHIHNLGGGIGLSLGNPHIVFTVPSIKENSLDNRGLKDLNVSFMQFIDRRHIQLRVFERGVGETKACGSAACAAVVAGITQHLLDNKVCVELIGGKLYIEWQGENHPVWMTGPAETVFEGKVNLPEV